MLPFNRCFIFIILLALVLTSCHLPASQSVEELDPKFIALTMVEQTNEADSARAAKTPLPTNIPTLGRTIVSVSSATNCRTGPGVEYPLVLTFQPGATAQVVGKYSPANYWIINTPIGGTCWLWGEHATVQGNTSALPEMAAPPPPVAAVEPTEAPPSEDDDDDGLDLPLIPKIPSGPVIDPDILKVAMKPSAPASFSATANCGYIPIKTLVSKIDQLTWSSVSNATGYKVYVNGSFVKDLSGTSTTIDALDNGSTSYGVSAYNSFGDSSVKTIPAPACP